MRELEATAAALESRRHPLHDFSGIFSGVAGARDGGWDSSARFHSANASPVPMRISSSGLRGPRRPSGAMCATRCWRANRKWTPVDDDRPERVRKGGGGLGDFLLFLRRMASDAT